MILPTTIYSPEQLNGLIMELRRYIDAERDASHRSDHGGKPHTSSALKSVFESTSDAPAEQVLNELEALVKNAPTVHVITAGMPGRKLRQQLVNWFRSEIHEHALLFFTERRDIGGGIIIRAGSHVYDFSIKRKILDNKHRITEIAFPPQQPAAEQQVRAAPQEQQQTQGAADVR